MKGEVSYMLAFSLVKRLGEGSYLNDDRFILERVRKERALNVRRMRVITGKPKSKPFERDGKPGTS